MYIDAVRSNNGGQSSYVYDVQMATKTFFQKVNQLIRIVLRKSWLALVVLVGEAFALVAFGGVLISLLLIWVVQWFMIAYEDRHPDPDEDLSGDGDF